MQCLWKNARSLVIILGYGIGRIVLKCAGRRIFGPRRAFDHLRQRGTTLGAVPHVQLVEVYRSPFYSPKTATGAEMAKLRLVYNAWSATHASSHVRTNMAFLMSIPSRRPRRRCRRACVQYDCASDPVP